MDCDDIRTASEGSHDKRSCVALNEEAGGHKNKARLGLNRKFDVIIRSRNSTPLNGQFYRSTR